MASVPRSDGTHRSKVILCFKENIDRWRGKKRTKLKKSVANSVGVSVGEIKLCKVEQQETPTSMLEQAKAVL